MKERSGMPYDVVAYEADEAAMLLTAEQEGIFHRLLRRSWMNGSIPDDIEKLARISRVTKLQMSRAWVAIRPLWVEGEPGRLLNAKQEREREWKGRYSTAQAVSGRLGGLAKAAKNKDVSLATAKRTLGERLASPSPSLPLPNLKRDEDVEEDGPLQLIALYNASKGQLPKALALTSDRRAKCRARLRGNNGTFLAQFEKSVRHASETPFCILGSNGSRWCNFDWFIANDTNYLKVLEGKYDGRKLSKAEERSKRETQATRQALGDLDAAFIGDLPEVG